MADWGQCCVTSELSCADVLVGTCCPCVPLAQAASGSSGDGKCLLWGCLTLTEIGAIAAAYVGVKDQGAADSDAFLAALCQPCYCTPCRLNTVARAKGSLAKPIINM